MSIEPRVEPLRVMFVITSMPVGGAETLLVNLVRHMDRTQFSPELCCLKELGPLGEVLAAEIPAYSELISHKYDAGVLLRLRKLMRSRKIDAVITVGTGGDKMFWGRLAAWLSRVPVVASALHSTGLPDRVERSNRMLASWTDAFIAVANAHGRYIAEHEGCPTESVVVIPNGVDIERFTPHARNEVLAHELGLSASTPAVAIVAALRPEKNHELFLKAAARVAEKIPAAQFLVIGDGPRRAELEAQAYELGVGANVRFLGSRSDVPELLSLVNLVALSSKMEASPVSLLEAMACGKPVVAPRVGSIPDSVIDGDTGLLFEAGDLDGLTNRMLWLLERPSRARAMGRHGRNRVVECYSLDVMVGGYQQMIQRIYQQKRGPLAMPATKLVCSPASSPAEADIATLAPVEMDIQPTDSLAEALS